MSGTSTESPYAYETLFDILTDMTARLDKLEVEMIDAHAMDEELERRIDEVRS